MSICFDKDSFLFYVENTKENKQIIEKLKYNKYWTSEENRYYTYSPITAKYFYGYCNDEAKKAILNFINSDAVSTKTMNTTQIYNPLINENIRNYQKVAVNYILNNKNILLADEMGLGKTAEIITSMCIYAKMNKENLYHAIIVCPAHLKNVWINEIMSFGYNFIFIKKYNGFSRSEQVKFDINTKKTFFVNIINYDILTERLIEIKNCKYDFIVFDESHYLKSLKSDRTKSAYKLMKLRKNEKSKVIFSSGTPITKSPIDLFPALNMVEHPIAQNWYYYAVKFCDAKKEKKAGRSVWVFGTSKANRLNSILRMSCMIRRTKDMVLKELPEKNRQIISLEADEVFKELIDEEVEALRYEKINIEDFEKKDINIPLTKKLAEIRCKIALKKAPHLAKIVNDILESTDDKIIIFAYHKIIIDKIQEIFNCEKIYGETPHEDREEIIKRFQRDKEKRILVASYLCMGTGITLTEANYAIFAELDYIPSNISQAEDRIYRIGQEKKTYIYYVVVEKTLEHYIAKKMLNRQSDINKVLNFMK